MKKNTLIAYLLLFVIVYSANAQSQRSDSLLFKLDNTSHLKPIVIGANGRYYYGGIRLRSNYSLEIPFGELDDPEVNHYFKSSRTIRTVGSVVAALPGIYYLVAGRNTGVSRQTFWITYVGALGVSLASNLIANAQIRKAVRTYNGRLTRPKLGLSVQEMFNNSLSLGIGLKVGFRN